MLKALKLLLMPTIALSLYSAISWADDDDDGDDKSTAVQVEGLDLSAGASDGFYLTDSYCVYYPDLPECSNYAYPYTAYYGWGGGWGGGGRHHHHGGHHRGGHHRR